MTAIFSILACIAAAILAIRFVEKLPGGPFFNREEHARKNQEQRNFEQFESIKKAHPEWAAELDPAEEKEKKDREEFERLAKEHPEWL